MLSQIHKGGECSAVDIFQLNKNHLFMLFLKYCDQSKWDDYFDIIASHLIPKKWKYQAATTSIFLLWKSRL